MRPQPAPRVLNYALLIVITNIHNWGVSKKKDLGEENEVYIQGQLEIHKKIEHRIKYRPKRPNI